MADYNSHDLDQRPKRAAGCCAFLLRRRRGAFVQTIVVLRHSERRDYVDSTYKESKEGKEWPFDTPLTERGVSLAREVAEELREVHDEAQFEAIASSPYRRCLQTAAQVGQVLQLPVLIDQEMGEVWDRHMPQSPSPHRSPHQLDSLVKDLGVKVLNPVNDNGIMKVFGKPPAKWPETLDDAKKRFIVRIEHYIQQSAETHRNFIIVTHADAVAAALAMFERGGADVQSMEFCAQVRATRKLRANQTIRPAVARAGAFADHWQVTFSRAGANIFDDPGSMSKYYERIHIEQCQENQKEVKKRHQMRTKTDTLFTDAIHSLGQDQDDADEDEAEKTKARPKPAS